MDNRQYFAERFSVNSALNKKKEAGSIEPASSFLNPQENSFFIHIIHQRPNKHDASDNIK